MVADYESADPRHGAEDRDIAVPPLFVVLLVRRLKLIEQSLDAGTTTPALVVDQAQAGHEQGNMFDGRFDYSGSDLKCGRLQCGNDIFCA